MKYLKKCFVTQMNYDNQWRENQAQVHFHEELHEIGIRVRNGGNG